MRELSHALLKNFHAIVPSHWSNVYVSPHGRLTTKYPSTKSPSRRRQVMSIPGLDQDEPVQDFREAVVQSKVLEVKKESEWRFEVNVSRTVTLKVC